MSSDTLIVEVIATTQAAALEEAVRQGRMWFETECVYAQLGEQLGTEKSETLGGEVVRIERRFEAGVTVIHAWGDNSRCKRCDAPFTITVP